MKSIPKIDPVRFKEVFRNEEHGVTQYEAVDRATGYHCTKWVYDDGHPTLYSVKNADDKFVLVFEDPRRR